MPRKPPAPSVSLHAAPGTLAFYVEPYLESLRVRHYSPMTLKTREYALRAFCLWAAERELHRAREVTPAALERYQASLYRHRKKSGEPLSVRSQHVQLTAVRQFFRWLCRQRHLALNPASELEMPRLGHRLPGQSLTVEEAERLLALPDVETPLGLRDRAVLEVFYSTGIRRSELARLRLSDVDAGRGVVFVFQGKGKKDRFVPIGERALAWVRKYLDEARPRLKVREVESLFLNRDGKQIDPAYLTEWMRQLLEASGVGKKGGCHLLRHTCATLMLEGGADVRYIQQMLGHSDLSTTDLYTQVGIHKLKAVHALAHPARMRKHRTEDVEAIASS